jgi:hypothetical protein
MLQELVDVLLETVGASCSWTSLLLLFGKSLLFGKAHGGSVGTMVALLLCGLRVTDEETAAVVDAAETPMLGQPVEEQAPGAGLATAAMMALEKVQSSF